MPGHYQTALPSQHSLLYLTNREWEKLQITIWRASGLSLWRISARLLSRRLLSLTPPPVAVSLQPLSKLLPQLWAMATSVTSRKCQKYSKMPPKNIEFTLGNGHIDARLPSLREPAMLRETVCRLKHYMSKSIKLFAKLSTKGQQFLPMFLQLYWSVHAGDADEFVLDLNMNESVTN